MQLPLHTRTPTPVLSPTPTPASWGPPESWHGLCFAFVSCLFPATPASGAASPGSRPWVRGFRRLQKPRNHPGAGRDPSLLPPPGSQGLPASRGRPPLVLHLCTRRQAHVPFACTWGPGESPEAPPFGRPVCPHKGAPNPSLLSPPGTPAPTSPLWGVKPPPPLPADLYEAGSDSVHLQAIGRLMSEVLATPQGSTEAGGGGLDGPPYPSGIVTGSGVLQGHGAPTPGSADTPTAPSAGEVTPQLQERAGGGGAAGPVKSPSPSPPRSAFLCRPQSLCSPTERVGSLQDFLSVGDTTVCSRVSGPSLPPSSLGCLLGGSPLQGLRRLPPSPQHSPFYRRAH